MTFASAVQPSAEAEMLAALTPALAATSLLLLAFIAYTVRSLSLGRFHDPEMDHRGVGGLTSAGLRHFFAWMMRPLWRGLALAGVPPNAITTLSFSLAVGAGVAAAVGRFALAGWVFIAAGTLDFLDGRVARETGKATRGGALLDSVLDRYCESALLVGLAWYYRSTWVLVPALLALTGSLFVPYVRARGEAIGVQMKDVGFMQRPERLALLGLGVAFGPVPQALLFGDEAHPRYHLAIAALVVLAATSHATALQRLAHLLRALGGKATTGVETLRRAPRALIVSAVATFCDYLVTRNLVEFHVASPPVATAVGCAVGGVIAFILSREWAFGARGGSVKAQAARYAFVSGTSALLNAGGVAIALLVPGADYRVGWVITRALVFATWNFPLLNGFAFPARERTLPALEGASEANRTLEDGAKVSP